MSPATPTCSVVEVVVYYQSRAERVTALDGISITLDRGETLAIVGPSGAGKTTLLDLLVGWRAPDAGHIVHAADRLPGWSGTAVVPQSLGLLEELTLRQNIELPARLGAPLRASADQLADRFGLDELLTRLPDEVSQGEQQRAALARALIAAPQLLIADEPTAHQDDLNAALIGAALSSSELTGTSTIVATHDERILGEFDRVVRIRNGRIEP